MSADPSARPPDLVAAAEMALKRFLPSLDSAMMKETHGFDGKDDFTALTLGEPFEPFVITPEAIRKSASGKVTDLLAPTGSWYFPVLSRGHIACIVSVAKGADGKLAAEKMGMPELARAWAAISEAWPASKGYTPRFIVVPFQRLYFTVPQADPPNLTRMLIDTKEAALPQTYERLAPASAVFAEFRS